MRRRVSSSESGSHKDSSADVANNIRTKPPHIYDSITRKLLQIGVTLAVITFIGLIVRYAVQEFDPSVSTITVTTSRVNNRDIASLSVSKNFIERILEFIEESIAIVAAIIPIGFPLCTIFNRHFAKLRAGPDRFTIKNNEVLNMIPKYVVFGDIQACQMPDSNRLRPLVRDTIYYLIKARLKPKLICEESYEDARRLGIRMGLIRRDHHKLAVIKSVDLLKNICDSRGDIKQGKVRHLLSRMKIMSQSTPADKSLLIYLIKHCETLPNENLVYLGHSFTDPEAMRTADCALSFQDCDDDDVKKAAHVLMKAENVTFTDVYLFVIVCLITSNVTQSYALYQISAAVSSCIYRFLSIVVFKEQLISHSQFGLIIIIQQIFAIIAIMTKWISSLPQTPMRGSVAEMSHAVTEDTYMADLVVNDETKHSIRSHHKSATSISGNGFESGSSGHQTSSRERQSFDENRNVRGGGGGGGGHFHTVIPMQKIEGQRDDTLGSSSLDDSGGSNHINHAARSSEFDATAYDDDEEEDEHSSRRRRPRSRRSHSRADYGGSTGRISTTPNLHRKKISENDKPVHLSGAELDQCIISFKSLINYKQTFHNTSFIDDVTYRLAKLHVAYQGLVLVIIMIFGNAMFQLNTENNRQHQTLALNSLIMNNIFNLANCFNQFGAFNLRSGFKNHPFLVCLILMSVAIQVCLTELNAFGLENLNPTQWFVCLVFALLSALIAPLTGQQKNLRKSELIQQQRQVALMSGGGGGDFPATSGMLTTSTPIVVRQRPSSAAAARGSVSPSKAGRSSAKFTDDDDDDDEN